MLSTEEILESVLELEGGYSKHFVIVILSCGQLVLVLSDLMK